MVVLNMGGEMVNILHQRLHAQNVEGDKRKAVLHDVICTMYSPKVFAHRPRIASCLQVVVQLDGRVCPRDDLILYVHKITVFARTKSGE